MASESVSGVDDVTPDGCSVESYARMPSLGEAEMLHGRLPLGAEVLDLGCGTGRIARPLAALGHPVVVVDESRGMLDRIPNLDGVRPIQQRIQDLRLSDRFEAVLFASNLINTRDETLRQAMLAICRDHLTQDGLVYGQWRRPEWFRSGQSSARLGDITVTQQVRDLGGDLFSVAAKYESKEASWRHDYVARRLTVEELSGALAGAGLALEEWITPEQNWFTAASAEPRTAPDLRRGRARSCRCCCLRGRSGPSPPRRPSTPPRHARSHFASGAGSGCRGPTRDGR
jgi:SAM-dependent methyltransferase